MYEIVAQSVLFVIKVLSCRCFQITCASSQLSQYQERYMKRLKARNLMYIRQIIFILTSLSKYLAGGSSSLLGVLVMRFCVPFMRLCVPVMLLCVLVILMCVLVTLMCPCHAFMCPCHTYLSLSHLCVLVMLLCNCLSRMCILVTLRYLCHTSIILRHP